MQLHAPWQLHAAEVSKAQLPTAPAGSMLSSLASWLLAIWMALTSATQSPFISSLNCRNFSSWALILSISASRNAFLSSHANLTSSHFLLCSL